MPVLQPQQIRAENGDILTITDEQGIAKIKIRRNGDLEIAAGLNVDDSIQLWWQEILEFMPCSDTKKALKTQISMIKLFSILKKLKEKNLIERLDYEDQMEADRVLAEANDNFYFF